MLKDEGVSKLCAGISHSRSLVYLNISQNCLTPKGMANIFGSLIGNNSICSLSVGNEGSYNWNRLGKVGASALNDLLKKN